MFGFKGLGFWVLGLGLQGYPIGIEGLILEILI
jgi:hypothetical protein